MAEMASTSRVIGLGGGTGRTLKHIGVRSSVNSPVTRAIRNKTFVTADSQSGRDALIQTEIFKTRPITSAPNVAMAPSIQPTVMTIEVRGSPVGRCALARRFFCRFAM